MRKIFIFVMALVMRSSAAWAWQCDEVYQQEIDNKYFGQLNLIAVNAKLIGDQESKNELEAYTPQLYKAVDTLIPAKIGVIDISYRTPDATIPHLDSPTTTVFTFVITSTKEDGFFTSKNIVKISLYTKRSGDKKTLRRADSEPFILSKNTEKAESQILETAKSISAETISAINCAKHNICKPQKPCVSPMPHRPAPRKFNSEDDALQRMKELEEKK